MNSTVRRIFGFLVGVLLGTAYAIIANFASDWVMPGVPLYQPWPGRFGQLFIDIMGTGLMGLIACWLDDAIPGVILSTIVGGVASSALIAQQQAYNSDLLFQTLALLFYTFLPRLVLLTPVAIVIRWVVHLWEEETLFNPFSMRKRLISTIVMLVAAGAFGVFSLPSQEAQQALTTLNQIIQTGMQANRSSDLPEALKPVDGFLDYAQGDYSLQVINNPDSIPVQRPITTMDTIETGIIIRFNNGYSFGCVFSPPSPNPFCRWY